MASLPCHSREPADLATVASLLNERLRVEVGPGFAQLLCGPWCRHSAWLLLLDGVHIYLARQPAVDLCKSIDGLSLLISMVLGEHPFSAHVFVFVNRRSDRLNALRWNQNSFMLYDKDFA